MLSILHLWRQIRYVSSFTSALFIGVFATEIVISVSQDFYREFDQGIGNSYIYVSPTYHGTLDKKKLQRLLESLS